MPGFYPRAPAAGYNRCMPRTPRLLLATGLAGLVSSLGCVELRVQRGSRDGSSSPPPSQPASANEQRQPGPQPAPAAEGVLALEARWQPLLRIEERIALPGVSSTTATTISPVVYVGDLRTWLKQHPPGSPHFEAVMLHEQVHARRQVAAGVEAWVQRYAHDQAFMWAEEQRGWWVHVQHLQSCGFVVDPAAVARNLGRYRNLSGPMCPPAEALRFAQDATQNRWRPPPE